jgi:hypothetical protein
MWLLDSLIDKRLMDNMHLINLMDQLSEIQKTKKININNQEIVNGYCSSSN